jgi:hypothetical protein
VAFLGTFFSTKKSTKKITCDYEGCFSRYEKGIYLDFQNCINFIPFASTPGGGRKGNAAAGAFQKKGVAFF